jgi:hypothetical protein
MNYAHNSHNAILVLTVYFCLVFVYLLMIRASISFIINTKHSCVGGIRRTCTFEGITRIIMGLRSARMTHQCHTEPNENYCLLGSDAV